MTLEQNLKRILLKKGLTQDKLSKKSGISQASISSYINDKINAKPKTVKNIAKAIGITIDEFYQDFF